MTKSKLRSKINSIDDENGFHILAEELLSEPVPWFFIHQFNENASQKYSEFRIYMSKKFNINSTDICLGGSAWNGYSLNPNKNFRDFFAGSDIDIVIINEKLYNDHWDSFFDLYCKFQLVEFDKISKHVFRRFIHYDYNETLQMRSKTYDSFQKKIEGYKCDLQTMFDFPDSIGYRIYRNPNDYVKNIEWNIRSLKYMEGRQNENNRAN